MNLVVTVNGVSVYSNMRMRRTEGTRVYFGRGNWCDVGTGEVHVRNSRDNTIRLEGDYIPGPDVNIKGRGIKTRNTKAGRDINITGA